MPGSTFSGGLITPSESLSRSPRLPDGLELAGHPGRGLTPATALPAWHLCNTQQKSSMARSMFTDSAFFRVAMQALRGEVRHEKDSCRCSDNAGFCTVRCTRSRARRRCGIRCIVRSSRLGTCRRYGRCRGRLHGRPLYCPLMGTEEIRPSSRWTIWKNIRERSFQSKISNARSCYVRSCRAGFAAIRETFDAISLRPERDAACPANGIRKVLLAELLRRELVARG
jgi:hypothetical protein